MTPALRVLRFGYDTDRVGGGTFADGTSTDISVASRSYPEGYQVKVTGARVTSEPGAPVLTVVTDAAAGDVFVKVWPVGQPEPPDEEPAPTPPTEPPGSTTTPGSPTAPVAPPGPAAPAQPIPGQAGYTG